MSAPTPATTIPGIRRIETGMRWIHYVDIDEVIDVPPEAAVEHAIRVARGEGLLIGLSSGAVTAAFEKLRKEGLLEKGDYVLVYPDHGFKYVEQFASYLFREKPGLGE